MIRFFYEKTRYRLPKPTKTSRWIKSVIEAQGFSLVDLNYVFCSDNYLLGINQSYLNHNYFTDIITFDYSGQRKAIQGEIYISIHRVRDNAKELGVSFEEELHRVIIHGVLHLMGHRDKSTLEKTAMRKKEEACLSLR